MAKRKISELLVRNSRIHFVYNIIADSYFLVFIQESSKIAKEALVCYVFTKNLTKFITGLLYLIELMFSQNIAVLTNHFIYVSINIDNLKH